MVLRLHPHSAGITGMSVLVFYIGTENLNSGLHAFAQSILTCDAG